MTYLGFVLHVIEDGEKEHCLLRSGRTEGSSGGSGGGFFLRHFDS